MKKGKLNTFTSKKVSFINKSKDCFSIDELNSEIKLGISLADEKAKQELLKRKVEAPLTTEERIFAQK